MSKYVYRLDPDKPNNTAAAICTAARLGGPTVLDVGSGPGIIASILAKNDGKIVTCVDIDAEAVESALQEGAAAAHVVDLRDDVWYRPLAGQSFDVVLLADVLEHLVDPERILRDIRRERLVSDDGRLVVSVPNANHEAIVVELLTGHFSYTDTGLLDRTHLRFFTLDSMTALLESCGFMVGEIHRTTMAFEATRQAYRAPEVSPALRAAIDELGVQGRTFQYVLTVHPTTESARITALGEQLEAAKAKVHEAQSATARTKAQLEQADAAREQALATAATLKVEAAESRRKLARIQASSSWRMARRLHQIARPWRAARRRRATAPPSTPAS